MFFRQIRPQDPLPLHPLRLRQQQRNRTQRDDPLLHLHHKRVLPADKCEAACLQGVGAVRQNLIPEGGHVPAGRPALDKGNDRFRGDQREGVWFY